jgi:hypothetical protein
VVVNYLVEPEGKTGLTKEESGLGDDGAERLAREEKRLIRSLRSSRGFTVAFGDGRVGRVIEVRLGLPSGTPRSLIAETVVFRPRRVEVPVADVASVLPDRGTLSFGIRESWVSQGRVATFVPPLGEAGEK